MAKVPPTEEYIQIYTEYHVLHWTAWDIAKKHGCSDDKVWDALHYVDDAIVDLPAPSLLKGAIFSIRERLKQNNQELEKIRLKAEDKNYPVYIGLIREIRADEQLLYTLTGLSDSVTSAKGLVSKEPVMVKMPGLMEGLLKMLLDEIKMKGITNIDEAIHELEKINLEEIERNDSNRIIL